MTDDPLTGKYVAIQESVGGIAIRAALDGGIDSPSDELQSRGLSAEQLYNSLSVEDIGEEQAATLSSLTMADVPPPREEAGHKHVLVVGEFSAEDGVVEATIYDDDDWETEFLGKDLQSVAHDQTE